MMKTMTKSTIEITDIGNGSITASCKFEPEGSSLAPATNDQIAAAVAFQAIQDWSKGGSDPLRLHNRMEEALGCIKELLARFPEPDCPEQSKAVKKAKTILSREAAT
jgi:hypothetical protein